MRQPVICQVREAQRGLSLVELMVAMVLGLLLLGGLIQMLISNKQTYTFQQSQSLNQENSRYAFYYVEEYLKKAGYRAAPQDEMGTVFDTVAADANCAQFQDGQMVSASLAGAGSVTYPGFCFRYQPSGLAGETDCSGNAVAGTTPIVTRIYLDTDNNRLMCGAQGAAARALVENIEDLNVAFGVAGAGTLAFVATPSDWREVMGVRVSVLTASDTQVLDAPQTYVFPPEGTTQTTAADRRAYRVSSKTVYLRNAVLE